MSNREINMNDIVIKQDSHAYRYLKLLKKDVKGHLSLEAICREFFNVVLDLEDLLELEIAERINDKLTNN